MTKQETLEGDIATTVVNQNRTDSFTIDIGRHQGNHMNNTPVGTPGWIGNPYPKSEYGREKCIQLFREDFHDRLETDEAFRTAVENLHGEVLGCYCAPKPCHGDVIVDWLNTRNP